MCKLHVHIIDKFQIQNVKIENLTKDLHNFKLDIGHTFGTFHVRFVTFETNVLKIIDILKQREEIKEFKLMLHQATHPIVILCYFDGYLDVFP